MFQLENNLYLIVSSADDLSADGFFVSETADSINCLRSVFTRDPENAGPQFSVFNCASEQSPAITVVLTEQTVYTYFEHAAERICHWITVTAVEYCREIVRTVIRKFCEFLDCAAFNRNTFIREGVLRL